ncbi:hypothetical protein SAMN05216490_4841 [Mucilaginibacter mallensis]|uniref:Uncharacterized protein n=1 Tax=Mucilaginibacter mallensis TaxID=652787 RepID=A0A1H2CC27_MUCMA|nr:hypothetical protein SAMN05216490_4841 [Mucilaginibacter mallensis]
MNRHPELVSGSHNTSGLQGVNFTSEVLKQVQHDFSARHCKVQNNPQLCRSIFTLYITLFTPGILTITAASKNEPITAPGATIASFITGSTIQVLSNNDKPINISG